MPKSLPPVDAPEYELVRIAQAGANKKHPEPAPTPHQISERQKALDALFVMGERTTSYYKRIGMRFGLSEGDAIAIVNEFFIIGIDGYKRENPYLWSHVQNVIFNRLRSYTKRLNSKLGRQILDFSSAELEQLGPSDLSMDSICSIILAKDILAYAKKNLTDRELSLLRWIVDEGGTTAEWATIHDEDAREVLTTWTAIRRQIERGVGRIE